MFTMEEMRYSNERFSRCLYEEKQKLRDEIRRIKTKTELNPSEIPEEIWEIMTKGKMDNEKTLKMLEYQKSRDYAFGNKETSNEELEEFERGLENRRKECGLSEKDDYKIHIEGDEGSGKNETVREISENLNQSSQEQKKNQNPYYAWLFGEDEDNDRRHEVLDNDEESQGEKQEQENNNEYDMVKVVWEDASSSLESIGVEGLKKLQTLMVASVGELIVKDEEKVILSFMSFSDNAIRHWQVIPRCSVHDIIYLKEAD